MGDSSSSSSSSTSSSNLGPLGINPLHFSATLFGLLFLFVLYLLLPKGIRVKYFGAYPKRYAWSARSRLSINSGNGGSSGGGGRQSSSSSSAAAATTAAARKTPTPYDGSGGGGNTLTPNYGVDRSGIGGGVTPLSALSSNNNNNNNNQRTTIGGGSGGMVATSNSLLPPTAAAPGDAAASSSLLSSSGGGVGNNEDIVVSAAMQQLRDPGVLIVAHGSRGKPKTVRLVLTELAITWRTEMRKKNAVHGGKELKLGKLHQVPLGHIMYVDIGKQTTALRRVENSAVSESLCFSLLTKEGSLDLEANSPRERDALVQCFSLVLDEVHAQNWRDIYRGPSSDMPSSFDEGENNNKIT